MVVKVKAMSSWLYQEAVLKVVTNVAGKPAASMFRVRFTSTIRWRQKDTIKYW
jgi:hypothetical protein